MTGLWYWATTYSPTCRAVTSARSGLTSLFGMGRGVPRRYNHRNLASVRFALCGIDRQNQAWPFGFLPRIEKVSGN